MKYTFNIIEKTNEMDHKSYLVFDSFNTFLGCFSNIELAYDSIETYLNYFAKIYSVSSYGSVSKQIKEILVKKDINGKQLTNLSYIDEIIASLIFLKKNKIEKINTLEKESIFSTSPIMLSENFHNVFDDNSITMIHKEMISKNIKLKNKDNYPIENLKKSLSNIFDERELTDYFPDMFSKKEGGEFLTSKKSTF